MQLRTYASLMLIRIAKGLDLAITDVRANCSGVLDRWQQRKKLFAKTCACPDDRACVSCQRSQQSIVATRWQSSTDKVVQCRLGMCVWFDCYRGVYDTDCRWKMMMLMPQLPQKKLLRILGNIQILAVLEEVIWAVINYFAEFYWKPNKYSRLNRNTVQTVVWGWYYPWYGHAELTYVAVYTLRLFIHPQTVTHPSRASNRPWHSAVYPPTNCYPSL